MYATRFEKYIVEEAQILNKAILASSCTGNTDKLYRDMMANVELTADNLIRT